MDNCSQTHYGRWALWSGIILILLQNFCQFQHLFHKIGRGVGEIGNLPMYADIFGLSMWNWVYACVIRSRKLCQLNSGLLWVVLIADWGAVLLEGHHKDVFKELRFSEDVHIFRVYQESQNVHIFHQKDLIILVLHEVLEVKWRNSGGFKLIIYLLNI